MNAARMQMPRRTRRAVASVVVSLIVLTAACVNAPPASAPKAGAATAEVLDWQATERSYRTLNQAHSGTVYQLDPANSDVRIYVYRAGSLGRVLGHNHVLRVPTFSGYAYAPHEGLNGARFDIQVHLETLAIDEPQVRAQTGGEFGGEIGAEGIAGTREHMLGEHSLQASRYPKLHLSAEHFEGELPKVIASLAVNLHGALHRQALPMSVTLNDQQLHATGTFTVRQSDFGITPYSTLGGALAVDDPLTVEFSLKGQALKEAP